MGRTALHSFHERTWSTQSIEGNDLLRNKAQEHMDPAPLQIQGSYSFCAKESLSSRSREGNYRSPYASQSQYAPLWVSSKQKQVLPARNATRFKAIHVLGIMFLPLYSKELHTTTLRAATAAALYTYTPRPRPSVMASAAILHRFGCLDYG